MQEFSVWRFQVNNTTRINDDWEIYMDLDDAEIGEIMVWLYDRRDNSPVFCWYHDPRDGWDNQSFGDPCVVRDVPAIAHEAYFGILRCFNWNHCVCCSKRFAADGGHLGDFCRHCNWEVDELEATESGFFSSANHTTLEEAYEAKLLVDSRARRAVLRT
jgi:hypothetical protein